MNRAPRPDVMTRKANASAAYIAVTMGNLDKLDAAFIARCHGLDVGQVQAMIDVRREREAGARG